MNTTSRSEHLEWCKKRAYQYLDQGNVEEAYASFSSDMNKHLETQNHFAIPIGMFMMMGGCSVEKMREFIKGFN